MATFRRTLINVPPLESRPSRGIETCLGSRCYFHCSPTLALRYGCNHRGKSSRRGAVRLVVNVMAKMAKRPRYHVEVIRHAYARLSNWFPRPASPYVHFAALAGRRLCRSCFAYGFRERRNYSTITYAQSIPYRLIFRSWGNDRIRFNLNNWSYARVCEKNDILWRTVICLRMLSARNNVDYKGESPMKTRSLRDLICQIYFQKFLLEMDFFDFLRMRTQVYSGSSRSCYLRILKYHKTNATIIFFKLECERFWFLTESSFRELSII